MVVVPVGHTAQSPPSPPAEYDPVEHLLHVVPSKAPYPGAHRLQSAADVLPVLLVVVPSGQLLHAPLLLPAAYIPFEQMPQVEPSWSP